MTCRLCYGSAERLTIGEKSFAACPRCGYIGLDPSFFLDLAGEKARYRLHRNSPSDRRYRAFIQAFLDATLRYVRPGGQILDFGSGPEPAPAAVLAEHGYSVSIWDPFFAPELDWEAGTWDCVFMHEVAEHLREPRPTLERLAARLRPGGVMLIRTRFAPADPGGFERWPYRLDPTHVGFFSERSAGAIAADLGLRPLLVEAPDRIVLSRIA